MPSLTTSQKNRRPRAHLERRQRRRRQSRTPQKNGRSKRSMPRPPSRRAAAGNSFREARSEGGIRSPLRRCSAQEGGRSSGRQHKQSDAYLDASSKRASAHPVRRAVSRPRLPGFRATAQTRRGGWRRRDRHPPALARKVPQGRQRAGTGQTVGGDGASAARSAAEGVRHSVKRRVHRSQGWPTAARTLSEGALSEGHVNVRGMSIPGAWKHEVSSRRTAAEMWRRTSPPALSPRERERARASEGLMSARAYSSRLAKGGKSGRLERRNELIVWLRWLAGVANSRAGPFHTVHTGFARPVAHPPHAVHVGGVHRGAERRAQLLMRSSPQCRCKARRPASGPVLAHNTCGAQRSAQRVCECASVRTSRKQPNCERAKRKYRACRKKYKTHPQFPPADARANEALLWRQAVLRDRRRRRAGRAVRRKKKARPTPFFVTASLHFITLFSCLAQFCGRARESAKTVRAHAISGEKFRYKSGGEKKINCFGRARHFRGRTNNCSARPRLGDINFPRLATTRRGGVAVCHVTPPPPFVSSPGRRPDSLFRGVTRWRARSRSVASNCQRNCQRKCQRNCRGAHDSTGAKHSTAVALSASPSSGLVGGAVRTEAPSRQK